MWTAILSRPSKYWWAWKIFIIMITIASITKWLKLWWLTCVFKVTIPSRIIKRYYKVSKGFKKWNFNFFAQHPMPIIVMIIKTILQQQNWSKICKTSSMIFTWGKCDSIKSNSRVMSRTLYNVKLLTIFKMGGKLAQNCLAANSIGSCSIPSFQVSPKPLCQIMTSFTWPSTTCSGLFWCLSITHLCARTKFFPSQTYQSTTIAPILHTLPPLFHLKVIIKSCLQKCAELTTLPTWVLPPQAAPSTQREPHLPRRSTYSCRGTSIEFFRAVYLPWKRSERTFRHSSVSSMLPCSVCS